MLLTLHEIIFIFSSSLNEVLTQLSFILLLVYSMAIYCMA